MQQDEHRQAELIAAGEVLRDWLYARRASWGDDPYTFPGEVPPMPWAEDVEARAPGLAIPPKADPPPVAPPPAPLPAPLPPLPLPAALPASVAAPVERDRPAPEPRSRFRMPAGAASIASSALRWSVRAAPIAAVVALIVGAGWIARPYVSTIAARISRLTATPKTGTAVLDSSPSGSDLFIDGTASGKTPLTIELLTGRHVVEFRRGKGSRKIDINVPGGGVASGSVDWDAVQTGRFMARSDPPGARVTIDGRERGTTPLTLEDLAIGSHVVILESDQGSVRRTVQVTADETALVSESIYSGWVKLFVPFPVEIREGDRVLRLDEQSQIMMAPGVHELQFESGVFGYRETKRVEVNPGKSTPVSLVPPPSTMTVTASEAAAVFVDGQPVGDAPLTSHPIALGTREIVVRTPAGAERRYTRQVTVAPLQIDVDFSQP